MPVTSAALLRKTTQLVLQDRILPDLLSGGVRHLVMARLPLAVSAQVVVRAMSHAPLLESGAKRIYPEGKQWNDVAMHALRFPSLYCVVEGEADLAMGVTTAMLGALAPPDKPEPECGGYIFSLRAPAYFLVPSGVPQKTLPPWQRDVPHTGTLRLFVVRVLPIGALCTLTFMQDGEYTVPYSLLVKDIQIAAAMAILVDEMSTSTTELQIAQAQLLTLMLRLKRHVSTQFPLMTDGLYARFPDSEPADWQAQSLHHSVVEQTHEFIQLHLHEPLTPAIIAAPLRLTPDHLNRIIKKSTGASLMNYVAQLRIESAQLLLRTSELSVQEISNLVGYRHLPHFSRAFLQHCGHSPLKFRQRESNRK